MLHDNIFAKDGQRALPLYEAKMIHHFDHRWASYDSDGISGPARFSQGGYPVAWRFRVTGCWQTQWMNVLPETIQWLLGFRRHRKSTDVRTMISAMIPRVGSWRPSARNAYCNTSSRTILLDVSLSSFVLDYGIRQKIGGTHLDFFYVRTISGSATRLLRSSRSMGGRVDFGAVVRIPSDRANLYRLGHGAIRARPRG